MITKKQFLALEHKLNEEGHFSPLMVPVHPNVFSDGIPGTDESESPMFGVAFLVWAEAYGGQFAFYRVIVLFDWRKMSSPVSLHSSVPLRDCYKRVLVDAQFAIDRLTKKLRLLGNLQGNANNIEAQPHEEYP